MLAAHRVLHAPTSKSYDATILADGPVAFWPLKESSGTTATDATGNGHNGTYSGGYTLGATGIGDGETAVSLNGSSGYITIPSATALQLQHPFTIEAWVSPASGSASGYTVASKYPSGGGGDDYAYGINLTGYSNPGNQELLCENLSIHANTSASVGTGWHYVAVTYDGTNIQFYKDGTTDGGTHSASGNPTTGTGPLTIGVEDNGGTFGNWFSGSIAKVALYNAALTSTQVSNHYAAA